MAPGKRNERDRNEAGTRDLLSVEQAAGYLQLSSSSIRSCIRQGKLKAFRIASLRKVLIPRAELLSLLDRQSAAMTKRRPPDPGCCRIPNPR